MNTISIVFYPGSITFLYIIVNRITNPISISISLYENIRAIIRSNDLWIRIKAIDVGIFYAFRFKGDMQSTVYLRNKLIECTIIWCF